MLNGAVDARIAIACRSISNRILRLQNCVAGSRNASRGWESRIADTHILTDCSGRWSLSWSVLKFPLRGSREFCEVEFLRISHTHQMLCGLEWGVRGSLIG